MSRGTEEWVLSLDEENYNGTKKSIKLFIA